MIWSVRFASGAIRGLDGLPARIRPAIVEFVTETLPTNSERMSKPLHGELQGYRSARRGDYRVVFRLDPTGAVLLVIRIAHRADAYHR